MAPLTLSRPQSIIWQATQQYRFVCICAGRRGGKTTIVQQLIVRALSQPNQTIWYVSVTYRLAKRLMWRRLKSVIPRQLIKIKNETELSIELVNGSTIQLFGADNPDGLVGEGIDHCFVDEAGLMKNLDEVVERSLRPALADKQGNMVLVSTPRGFNYFYELSARSWNFPYSRPDRVVDSKQWFFYGYTTKEGGNVSDSELAEIAATMSPKLYEQEMNGTFTTPANRVYEYYDYEVNRLGDEELAIALKSPQILVGIDFNVNPMTAIVAVAHGEECWVIDSLEIQTSNTEELAQEIINRYPGKSVLAFPDPAGKARKTSAAVGVTDFSILQKAGFTVIAPNRAPMVVDRINCVNAMLCDAKGKRRLLVHGRAKSLIQSLNGQCYKEGTSQPEKGGNPDLSHACFAAGTLIDTDKGLIPIELAPKTGMVKTFDGSYQLYHSNELKGLSQTVRVTLNNGKIVICTPNHLFLTTDGWIEAINLTGKTLCKTQSSYRHQNKFLTGYRSIKDRLRMVKYNTLDLKKINRKNIFTDMFGLSQMAKYLQTTISTISTKIPATTRSRTLSAYPDLSILASTWLDDFQTQSNLRKQEQTLTLPESLLISGMDRQKVEDGTVSTRNKSSIITEQLYRLTALDVANYLVKPLQELCTAVKNVLIKPKPLIAEAKEKIARSEIALFVKTNLNATNTFQQSAADLNVVVECVSKSSDKIVYCLTVPDWGCFTIADDIVVSNCDGLGYMIWSRFNLFAEKASTGGRVY